MGTVSQITIRLSENLQCDYLCKRIQDLVNNYSKESGSPQDKFLVLEIKDAQDGYMDYTKKLTFIES